MNLNRHNRINIILLVETILVFAGLIVLANLTWQINSGWKWVLYLPILFFQGLWLDRIYIVGHETTHGKLFPKNKKINEICGFLMLMPLAVPLQIYRKIHQFHHGFNRRDVHTSALDTFVSKKPLTKLRRTYFQILWFVGVFGSGYFWHSLAAIVIFLFLPTKTAAKISPAFKNWTTRDRLISWTEFLLGLSFHFGFYIIGGFEFWLISLGFPMLIFAWVWSLLVYIFHYDTTIGRDVRFNARSLPHHWFFSWLLMNFNEHTTHHAFPNIPWHQLPENRVQISEKFSANQNVKSVWEAILQQIKGANIVYEPDSTASRNN